MFKKEATFTQAQVKEMIAQAVAQAIAQMTVSDTEDKGDRTDAPKEKVPFVKKDGTTVYGTPAQVAQWTKWRDGAGERKERFENMKATWADKKASYKPSKELTDAIKANRASITHKIARDKYGFVGTKQDLKALKESLCK